MKKKLIFTLAAACSYQVFGMEKEHALQLIRDIQSTLIITKKILETADYNPKAIDDRDRQKANDQLTQLKSSAEKLRLILFDQDGWITNESEK